MSRSKKRRGRRGEKISTISAEPTNPLSSTDYNHLFQGSVALLSMDASMDYHDLEAVAALDPPIFTMMTNQPALPALLLSGIYTIDRIIEEIKIDMDKFGVQTFRFVDSCFNLCGLSPITEVQGSHPRPAKARGTTPRRNDPATLPAHKKTQKNY